MSAQGICPSLNFYILRDNKNKEAPVLRVLNPKIKPTSQSEDVPNVAMIKMLEKILIILEIKHQTQPCSGLSSKAKAISNAPSKANKNAMSEVR